MDQFSTIVIPKSTLKTIDPATVQKFNETTSNTKSAVNIKTDTSRLEIISSSSRDQISSP